ncbi:hypothetical protein [Francisella sp. LA112445]|uniref:hypothetical protein n=1 Tax=Francisella sp. LA112445 TaxID=1395624 RepID=UPI001788AAC2|nr:hypothetical protein [Francisella sp. LA112445]QIW10280.1 hypothetical protein FIP56_06055 [Francisella sp. LA112445]
MITPKSIILTFSLIFGTLSLLLGLPKNSNDLQIQNPIKVLEKSVDHKYTTYFYRNMPYALCSKALCTWKKGQKATCFCPIIYPDQLDKDNIWMGASLSPYDLDKTIVTYKNNKINTVVSTFSLANTVDSQVMATCKAKPNVIYSWANCFGVRCNVTQNLSIAECKCPIEQSKDYISMGVKSENMCFNGASANDNYSFGWSADNLKNGLLNKKVIVKLYKKYFPSFYS